MLFAKKNKKDNKENNENDNDNNTLFTLYRNPIRAVYPGAKIIIIIIIKNSRPGKTGKRYDPYLNCLKNALSGRNTGQYHDSERNIYYYIYNNGHICEP